MHVTHTHTFLAYLFLMLPSPCTVAWWHNCRWKLMSFRSPLWGCWSGLGMPGSVRAERTGLVLHLGPDTPGHMNLGWTSWSHLGELLECQILFPFSRTLFPLSSPRHPFPSFKLQLKGHFLTPEPWGILHSHGPTYGRVKGSWPLVPRNLMFKRKIKPISSYHHNILLFPFEARK